MIEFIFNMCLGFVGGFLSYFALDWTIRRKPAIIPPSVANAIIMPLATGAEDAPYVVRCNGRELYRGWDLDRAKVVFKNDVSRGVIELYSRGNHVASRHG